MSLEEDRKLIDAVRSWRPPKTLHPMAMRAWRLYDENGNKLPAAAVQALRDDLNAYGTDLKGLAEALEGLARFMLLATETGDKAAAQTVAELMREYTHLFEPFWEKVGEALQNVGADAQVVFHDFIAAEKAPKTAPAFGEKPPQGTVPVKDLLQPGRPPVWAPKKK